MEQVNGATLLQFKARVAAICLQQHERILDSGDVEDCWYIGLTPRECFDELLLFKQQNGDKHPSREGLPPRGGVEFSESAAGQEARYRWARKYEGLNGAPEGDDDA